MSTVPSSLGRAALLAARSTLAVSTLALGAVSGIAARLLLARGSAYDEVCAMLGGTDEGPEYLNALL
jgi:hypothetical protein